MFAKLVVKSFSDVSNFSKPIQKTKSAFVACAVRIENVRSKNQQNPKPNTPKDSYCTNATTTTHHSIQHSKVSPTAVQVGERSCSASFSFEEEASSSYELNCSACLLYTSDAADE